MLGKIEFVEFKGLDAMPQKASSAWSAVDGGLCETSYKPLIYIGKQQVRGGSLQTQTGTNRGVQKRKLPRQRQDA